MFSNANTSGSSQSSGSYDSSSSVSLHAAFPGPQQQYYANQLPAPNMNANYHHHHSQQRGDYAYEQPHQQQGWPDPQSASAQQAFYQQQHYFQGPQPPQPPYVQQQQPQAHDPGSLAHSLARNNSSNASLNSVISFTSSLNSMPHTPRDQIMESPSTAAANRHVPNALHNASQHLNSNASSASSIHSASNGNGAYSHAAGGFTKFSNLSGLSIATSDDEDRAHYTRGNQSDKNNGNASGPGNAAWTKEEDKVLLNMYYRQSDNPQKAPVAGPGAALPYGLVHRVVRDTAQLVAQKTGHPFPHSLAETRRRLHYLYGLEQQTQHSQAQSPPHHSSRRGQQQFTRSHGGHHSQQQGGADEFDFSADNRMQNIGPLNGHVLGGASSSSSSAGLMAHNIQSITSGQVVAPPPVSTIYQPIPVQTPPSPPGLDDIMRLQSPWLPKQGGGSNSSGHGHGHAHNNYTSRSGNSGYSSDSYMSESSDSEALGGAANRNTLTAPVQIPGIYASHDGAGSSTSSNSSSRSSSSGAHGRGHGRRSSHHRPGAQHGSDADRDTEMDDDFYNRNNNRNTLTAPIEIQGLREPENSEFYKRLSGGA